MLTILEKSGQKVLTKLGLVFTIVGMKNLMEALEAKRAKENLSVNRFAAKLGVSDTMYVLVLQGKRDPGVKFIRGIVRAYPDLVSKVIDYMFQPLDLETVAPQ